MLIVDAQVHIWASGTPAPNHRQVATYTKDELLREMDAAGVDAALIHPPSLGPRRQRAGGRGGAAASRTGSRSSATSRSTGRRAAR